MSETRLVTSGDKPDSIPEENIYLTLIADEIRSYGIAHYPDEYLAKPANLSINYLKYNKSYWATFETCLRNSRNKSLAELKKHQDVFLPDYKRKTEQAIKNTLEYIAKEISHRNFSLTFKINENLHAKKRVKKLLKKRSVKQKSNEDEREDSDSKKVKHQNEQDRIVTIRNIPDSYIAKLEPKIKAIAQNYLMIKALEHAIQRAEENVKEGKYRFKIFKDGSAEIYKDLMYNSDEEPKLSKLDRNSNADLINEAADNYEVIGKPEYRMNRRKLKKTLRDYFKPRLKKLREKHDKPE